MDQRQQQAEYSQSSSASYTWPAASPTTSTHPGNQHYHVQMDSSSSRMIGGTVGPSQFHHYQYPTPQAYDQSYPSAIPSHSAPNSIPYQSYGVHPAQHQPQHPQPHQPIPSSQISPFQPHHTSQRSSASSSEIVSPSSALSEPSVQTPSSSDAYLGFGFNSSSSVANSTQGAPTSIPIPSSQNQHPSSTQAPPSAPSGYLNTAPGRIAPKGNGNLVVSLPPSNLQFPPNNPNPSTNYAHLNRHPNPPNPNPNKDMQDFSTLPLDPPPPLQDQFTGKIITSPEDLMEYRRMLDQASRRTAVQFGGAAYASNGSGGAGPHQPHANGNGSGSGDLGSIGTGADPRSRRGSGGSSVRGSGSGKLILRVSSYLFLFFPGIRAYAFTLEALCHQSFPCSSDLPPSLFLSIILVSVARVLTCVSIPTGASPAGQSNQAVRPPSISQPPPHQPYHPHQHQQPPDQADPSSSSSSSLSASMSGPRSAPPISASMQQHTIMSFPGRVSRRASGASATLAGRGGGASVVSGVSSSVPSGGGYSAAAPGSFLAFAAIKRKSLVKWED